MQDKLSTIYDCQISKSSPIFHNEHFRIKLNCFLVRRGLYKNLNKGAISMLRRFSKPSETKEYSVIMERSQGVRYFVAEVEEKDRRTINSYIDELIFD